MPNRTSISYTINDDTITINSYSFNRHKLKLMKGEHELKREWGNTPIEYHEAIGLIRQAMKQKLPWPDFTALGQLESLYNPREVY